MRFLKLDLEQDLKNFEYWLCKVEYIIESLHIEADWSLGEIEKRLNQHNVIILKFKQGLKVNNKLFYFSSVYNTILSHMQK